MTNEIGTYLINDLRLIIQVVLVMLMDIFFILQYLTTKFNSLFILDSRRYRLSLLKNIFVSSANVQKDSFLSN